MSGRRPIAAALAAAAWLAGAAAADPGDRSAPAPAEDVVPPSPREVLFRALENRYDLDARASIEITVTSKGGGKDYRRAEVASKRVNGLIQSFGRFTYPDDLRDMAVLRIENPDRDDDFFAFMPEMRRVRRLSAGQSTDLFVGTDATFEDLERRRIEDYEVEFLRSERVDGEDAFRVLARPAYESGYARVEYAIARSDYAILRMLHYRGDSEEPFKVIETPRATTETHGGHVLPMRVVVRDELRETRTEVVIKRIAVDPELPDRLFTTRALAQEQGLPDFD